jgi:hypothetical protein
MVDVFRRTLPEPLRRLLFDDGPYWPTRTAMFPNLMMLNVGAHLAPDKLVPCLACRVFRPLDPGRVEVWSWVLVEQSASDEFKRDSQRAYVLTFGPTGTEEQDDMENFGSISRALRGRSARRIDQVLPMSMDLTHADSILSDDWGGPGIAVGNTYTDAGHRKFAAMWADAMREPVVAR